MSDNTPKPSVVAFVGDSLTEAGNWDEWFPEYQTLNFGVSGNTTDDLLARLHAVIEARPDAIVLLAGTNDLSWRHSAEHIVRNIESVLVEVRKELPGARILVQSLMPRAAEFADRIADVNRHLWQFAPSVYAQYLDLWPAMATGAGELNPAFSDDRLHLEADGYDAWLAELRPAMERLFELPPTSRSITLPRDDYARPVKKEPPSTPPTSVQPRSDEQPETWSPS